MLIDAKRIQAVFLAAAEIADPASAEQRARAWYDRIKRVGEARQPARGSLDLQHRPPLPRLQALWPGRRAVFAST